MIYIKYIGKRKNKNGTPISWAWFFCEYCEKYVEKRLAIRKKAKSCGCAQYKLASIARIGQKRTDETRIKQSKASKGKKKSEEHIKNMSKAQKGKKISEETRQKRIIKGASKGKKNPMYGKNHTEISRQRISKTRIDKGIAKGENNSQWQGGKSFEPYGIEFDKEFKQQIFERDNYTCQCSDCEHKSNLLDAHHIDYDKKNNIIENIITLCRSCHSKTNGKKNRQYYTEFYQNIMMNKLMECFL